MVSQLFEAEYKKHEKALFLVAVAYVHNTEDAKDILQDSAMSAYISYEKLRNKEYFKTWMTRIVINKCKNFLKSKRYTEELNDNLNLFCNITESDFEIMDAICNMPPNLSVYITLKFYNDMTYKEMAKSLKQPVSTVKYKTKTAIDALKKLLEED